MQYTYDKTKQLSLYDNTPNDTKKECKSTSTKPESHQTAHNDFLSSFFFFFFFSSPSSDKASSTMNDTFMMVFAQNKQHFMLNSCSGLDHRFSKSHKVLETSHCHSTTMASFAMPFSLLVTGAQST